jgi:integrase
VYANENENASGKKPALRRRFQEGSWRCRTGVWSCKYREYITQPDGTQTSVDRGKSFPGLSERAAMAAMQPILDALNATNKAEAKNATPKSAVTLSDAVAEWRKLVAPNLKPRGLETAESHLRAHIIPKLGSVSLSELDVRRLQQFVMKIAPGRSGKTVENIVLTLSGILGHVRKWYQDVPIVKLSDLSMPEKVKAKPRFYEISEIKRLLAAACEPLRTILLVLVMTGMRINEALALRVEDLDFSRKVISVRHSAYNGMLGTPKSEASVADLHMPPELEKALRKFILSKHYQKNDLGLLFCNCRLRPYSDNKLREKMIRPLLVSLRMYSPGRVFHAIRHTAGSIMLESGASILNVQKQLRHSSATVTLNVYGHVLGNSQRNAANKLAKRLICRKAKAA